MRIKRSSVAATVVLGVAAVIAFAVVLSPRFGAHAAGITYNIDTTSLNASVVAPTVNNGYTGPVVLNGSDGSSVTATIAVILSSGQIYNGSGANITAQVTNASAVLAAFQSIITAQAAATATLSISYVKGFNPTGNVYTTGTAIVGTYLVLQGNFDAAGDGVLIDQSPVATSYESVSQINVPLTGIAVGSSHTVIVKNSLHQSNAGSFAVTSSAGVNGVCGSAANQIYATPPTTNLCSTGTSSYPGASRWSWTCSGSNGGSSASCSATYQAQQYAGTLSIAVASPNGNFISYNNGFSSAPSFMAGAGEQYSLTLSNGPASTSTNICAIIGSYTGCTPAGSTGQDGSWNSTGTWPASTSLGRWNEWLCFGSASACDNSIGTRSSAITFNMTAAPAGTIVCPFTGPLTQNGIGQIMSPYFLPNPQQNFYGTVQSLNNLYYSTTDAANQLASCIGNGATVTMENPAYSLQPEAMIKFTNGNTLSAGELIDLYVSYGGIPLQGTHVGPLPPGFVSTVEQEEKCTTTNYSDPICPQPHINPPAPSTVTKVKVQCNGIPIGGTSLLCYAEVDGEPGNWTYPGNLNQKVTWNVSVGNFTVDAEAGMVNATSEAFLNVPSGTYNGGNWITISLPTSTFANVTSTLFPSLQEKVTATSQGDSTQSNTQTISLYPPYPAFATPISTTNVPVPANDRAQCSGAFTDDGNFTSLGAVPASDQSIRYINIIAKQAQAYHYGPSWIAFNEIQAYDANGNLIPVASSSVWVGTEWVGTQMIFTLEPQYDGASGFTASTDDIGAAGLVDGNLNTWWSSGGSGAGSALGPALYLPDDFDQTTHITQLNPSDQYPLGMGGIITIDLGTTTPVSRISLLAHDDDFTSSIYTISGSVDGTTFMPLGILGGAHTGLGAGANDWVDLTLGNGLIDLRQKAASYPSAVASCAPGNNPSFVPVSFTLPPTATLLQAMAYITGLPAAGSSVTPPPIASSTPPAPPVTNPPPAGNGIPEGSPLVLTGSFGDSGNTVSIITPSALGGSSAGATIISQSATEINVSLAGVMPGSYTALVVTPTGVTESFPFSVVAGPGTNLPSSAPPAPPATNCTSSANANTLLTLQQSLQAIGNSLTSSSGLSNDTIATLQAVVNSLGQVVLNLLNSSQTSGCSPYMAPPVPPVSTTTIPIVPPAASSSIIITAPMFNTGGGAETQGTDVIVKWTGGTQNVNVELFQNNAQVGLIADNIQNNGTYDWTVPTTRSGSGYQIVVAPTGMSAAQWSFGESGTFSIVP